MTRMLIAITCLCILVTLASCRTTQNPQAGAAWQNIGLMLMGAGQQQLNNSQAYGAQARGTQCINSGTYIRCW